MRPAARLQAVIEILDALEGDDQPVDRFLRDWFRARRYAGSGDRAAITELVFTIVRHRSSLAWRMGGDAPRRLAAASLLMEGKTAEEVEILFDGSEYGPASLSVEEREALAAEPFFLPPLCVPGEFPPFLDPELKRAFGENVLEEMKAMQGRAPVDLRVNTLKTSRDEVAEVLLAEDFAAMPTPWSPVGLRLPPGGGMAKLSETALFEDGAFEFQDEASQIAALLCAVRPGLRVLDMAAGGGGKSLALAAAMQNKGEIVAYDINRMRLAPLEPRAARAGVTIIATSPPAGTFDMVLVDSPCSGSGTWRRQPELRWRITPDRLAEMTSTQDTILSQAAYSVKPGGRLVYVTCSVLPSENEDRITHFRADHPGFEVVPAADVWREAVGTPPSPGMEDFFRASPLKTGTDGFFTAVLRRTR